MSDDDLMNTDDDDNPPPGFSFMAKLNASITSLTDVLTQARITEQKKLSALPNYVTLERQSNPGTATTDVQDFGMPQAGRMWQVQLLLAFASPLAANAAVVTWMVGQAYPPSNMVLYGNWARWQFASVPGQKDLSGDKLTVLPGQHLIALLTSIPAASVINLNVAILDMPLSAATVITSSE